MVCVALDSMNPVNQFLTHLADLEDKLAGDPAKPRELCRQYCAMRDSITPILPFVERIPIYGRTIAKIIRTLMEIANQFCHDCGSN